MNTVIDPKALDLVRRGPARGVVDAIEKQPDGSRKVTLRPPSVRWNPKTERVELRPEIKRSQRVPQAMVDRMYQGLPTEIRRTARERFQKLVLMLVQEGRRFSRNGEIVWPASVERELAILGAAQGKADVVSQAEALARRYIEHGANKAREQDQRRVTADWHRHYSA